MKILLSCLLAISLHFSTISFALAQSAPTAPAQEEAPPAITTPTEAPEPPERQEPAPTEAEESLNQSDPSPSEAPGSRVRQPSVPEGGQDLMQQSMGKNNGAGPRFALTLAGGGARGAAHIGVLKRLEAAGLRPDFIAGSSIGSAIGALYAGGVPVSEIERMALDGRFKRAYFPMNFYLKTLIYVPTYIARRLLFMKPIPGIYTGKSIARFIRRSLPEGHTRIEDLRIPFAAIAVNLLDTKPFWITKGDVGSAVQASCTVAGLYKPVDTGERLLVDGGLRANLPADVGKAAGAPVVVGVRLHSILEAKDKKDFGNIINYGDRVTSIMVTEIESKAMADADIVISPEVEEINLASFTSEQLAKAIREGEIAADKAIPRIKEMLRRSEGTAARPDAEQLQN